MPDFSLHMEVIFFWLKTKLRGGSGSHKRKMHWKCLFDTISNMQEGIISNNIRHAGSNSNRKSLVPADRATQGFWHGTSTPGLCGPLPPPISLAWERSQHLVPVGGGPSCPCIAHPSQTVVGPHTLSGLEVLGRACLCSRAQEEGYIAEIIWKRCFCWRGENLETHNSSKSPIKFEDWPLTH